jgi:hypothetical protein
MTDRFPTRVAFTSGGDYSCVNLRNICQYSKPLDDTLTSAPVDMLEGWCAVLSLSTQGPDLDAWLRAQPTGGTSSTQDSC